MKFNLIAKRLKMGVVRSLAMLLRDAR